MPALERARVERALDKFCDRVRRDSFRIGCVRIRGNAVVLLERRPHFRDRTRHTEQLFAKFVYLVRPLVGGPSGGQTETAVGMHTKGSRDVPHFRDVASPGLKQIHGGSSSGNPIKDERRWRYRRTSIRTS
jgi:hypothetical protein